MRLKFPESPLRITCMMAILLGAILMGGCRRVAREVLLCEPSGPYMEKMLSLPPCAIIDITDGIVVHYEQSTEPHSTVMGPKDVLEAMKINTSKDGVLHLSMNKKFKYTQPSQRVNLYVAWPGVPAFILAGGSRLICTGGMQTASDFNLTLLQNSEAQISRLQAPGVQLSLDADSRASIGSIHAHTVKADVTTGSRLTITGRAAQGDFTAISAIIDASGLKCETGSLEAFNRGTILSHIATPQISENMEGNVRNTP